MGFFSGMFKKSEAKKSDDFWITIMYVAMCEWGWSYNTFKETPYPVLMALLKKHTEVNKKKNKK